MGSIISRIDDIIEEYGSFENYLRGVFPPEYHQIPKIMNYKIIPVPEFEVYLLVYRDYDVDGDPAVIVTTFVKDKEGEEYQIEEVTSFKSAISAVRFITDFSAESAKEFVAGNIRT